MTKTPPPIGSALLTLVGVTLRRFSRGRAVWAVVPIAFLPVLFASFVHDRRITGPKVVLGDFNEWMRGLATEILSARLQSIDLRAHLRRRRTYPGVFPVLHLDHIYYEGSVEVVKVDLPRTRRSLMASDHLPLVADLRVQFN